MKRAAAITLATIATATAIATLPAIAATPPRKGEVAITITDLRSDKGVVRACMTTNPDVFPRCREDPKSHRITVPAGKRVELMFSNVKPGRYAVALLHDENDNGKADRALGMMPREGFGFSRDAPVRMGPPSFDAAAFDYNGKAEVLTIHMRYML